jgi:hypothetical protein
MLSISASASTPAYPPPMKTKLNARRRVRGSSVVAATSSCSNTWLRSQIASPMPLNPTPFSRRPGMGSVRDTEPGATTTWSYGTSTAGPMIGCTVATRSACEMWVTSPESTRQSRRIRRNGTTAWRGEMLPAAASGRNGW